MRTDKPRLVIRDAVGPSARGSPPLAGRQSTNLGEKSRKSQGLQRDKKSKRSHTCATAARRAWILDSSDAESARELESGCGGMIERPVARFEGGHRGSPGVPFEMPEGYAKEEEAKK
ncbi:hypothetical protein KM043_008585 [Ampulex compressa]|nr:hypothetical protein KM043_008585 [Ampulex compressa]